MKRVVVVGSLNADLVVLMERFPEAGATVPGTGFLVHPGGKGANQACAAARLDAPVFMVGRVGRDSNGRLLAQSLEASGVDIRPLREDTDAPTGVALIEIDASGQNRIVVVPGANGEVTPADVESAAAALFDLETLVLVQLEIPVDTVEHTLKLAHARGALTILDPAPAHPESIRLVPLADFVTPNEIELGALVEEPSAATLDDARRQARLLLEQGAHAVVAKRGAEGALLVTPDRERLWPAPRVAVLDTTAAGDCWNGAFAAGLAVGQTEDQAGRLATEAAALSVTRLGAQPSMPTRHELDRFLRSRQEIAR